MKAVALLSGGLDSTILAYKLKEGYPDGVTLLSFDYGQRHRKELQVAQYLAEHMGVEHHTIDMMASFPGQQGWTNWGKLGEVLFTGSSLTDASVEVPDGHYAEETMKVTVVPNRNAIMLSIAYGVAVAQGASVVAFAAHAGDHAIYPDCRPDFVSFLNKALQVGNEWAEPLPEVIGPFLNLSKADIVKLGAELDVPMHLTWSCYKGGDRHCGQCGTCTERREAFMLADVPDQTAYEYTGPLAEAPTA